MNWTRKVRVRFPGRAGYLPLLHSVQTGYTSKGIRGSSALAVKQPEREANHNTILCRGEAPFANVYVVVLN
jgi:hypothetical protein